MWWKRVRTIISRARTSTYRTTDGKVMVNESSRFKALPLSAHQDINNIVETENKLLYSQICGKGGYETLDVVKSRSSRLGPVVLNSVQGPASLVERVSDALGYRDYFTGGRIARSGGVGNTMWMTGMDGSDPARANVATPLYISPSEAVSIYSQKGLPETIINKKSKSMLLNGVQIVNPLLKEEQLEKINEKMIKTDLPKAISDSLRDSLVFSGSLLFPFFNTDTPVSMTMPVELLARLGVVKRNCIDRWVVLDRWNTVHFPNWNPTAEEFRKPKYFYVPFLGTDVHSSRIARVVTSPQPGYWGVMMNMGWGVSDIAGWIEAVYNYYNVMQAIPTMISQMSILARTFNIDGPMALEGAMILEQMSDEETIRIRESSPLNPINMDVIGELKSIQRDFSEVPELCRLIRQDVAAKSGFLEQSLFTVEPKGMGSGTNAQPWTRQEETNRLIYTDVQQQLRQIAKLQVIDALGTDRDIIKALPFTEIRFDEQKITDVDDRTKAVEASTKGFFDIVAGGLPLSIAATLMEQLSGNLFKVDAGLTKELEQRQAMLDEREEEKHEAEIALLEAQVEAALRPPVAAGGASPSSPPSSSSATKSGAKDPKKKEGHSYEDPLKQKKMEKVSHKEGGRRRQGLAKAQGKRVK